MLNFFSNLDQTLFLFLNGLHAHGVDRLFYWISNRFIWIPLYIIILFLMIKKWRKKTIIILIALILAITFTDQSCSFLKKSIKRNRPSHKVELSEQIHLIETPNGEVYRGGPYGFPSSHAANSMVLAFFVIFFLSRKKTWIIFSILLWSFTISYSRIYLGVHYPFDLLTGWCIGAFWSLLFIYPSNRIIHHSYYIHLKKQAK